MQIGQKKEIHKALIWFLNVLLAYRHWQPENILARNVKLTTLSVFLLLSRLCFISVLVGAKKLGGSIVGIGH